MQIVRFPSQTSPAPVRPPASLQRAFGRARLEVAAKNGQTRLQRLYQEGASKIRFPRHTPGGDMEAILINTAGGMTGGDDISLSCEIGEGARLSVTTQGCERVYRSLGHDARYAVSLALGQHCDVRWLPQETILFDNGRLNRTITVDMAAGARLLIVESMVFGRQDMGETISRGAFRDRWEIRSAGSWIHAEQFGLDTDIAGKLAHPACAGSNPAMATLLLIGDDAEARLGPCREILKDCGGVVAGASFVPAGAAGKLIVRAVAGSAYALRKLTVRLIASLSAGAPPPRIWTT